MGFDNGQTNTEPSHEIVGGQAEQKLEPRQTGTGRKKIIAVLSIVVAVIIVGAAYYGLVQSEESQEPSQEPTASVVISEKLKRPENDPGLRSVTVDGDTITYIYGAEPREVAYSVGDYIVGTNGSGYLRKITALDVQNNTVIVRTGNASLSDVILKGQQNTTFNLELENSSFQIASINSTRTLVLDGEEFRVTYGSDMPRITATADEYSFSFTLPNFALTIQWWDASNQAYKNGISLSIEELTYTSKISVILDVEFNWWLSLQYAKIAASVTQTIDMKGMSLAGYFSLGNHLEKEIPLLPDIPLGWLLVPILTIPVLFGFTWKVGLDLEAVVEASGLTGNCTAQFTTTAGIEFRDGSWSPISPIDFTLTPQIETGSAAASIEFKEHFLAQLEIEVDGGLGTGTLSFGPYLYETLTVENGPRTSLDIGFGISIEISLEFNIIIWKMEITMTLFDYRFDPVLSWRTPSSPLNLVAMPGDGAVSLSWASPSDSGGLSITRYNIYRGDNPGEEVYQGSVTAYTYLDEGLQNGVYYYFVRAVNLFGEGEDSVEVAALLGASLSPHTRHDHSMASIWEPGKVLLFGGYEIRYEPGPSPSNWFGDTWVFDSLANIWTNMSPVLAPSPRSGSALAGAYGTDKVVLYGGYDPATQEMLADTWVYDYSDNSWTRLTFQKSPELFPEMSSVAGTDKVLLVGPPSEGNVLFNWGPLETWTYDLSDNSWQNMSPANSPGNRIEFGLTGILNSDQVLLFGGLDYYFGFEDGQSNSTFLGDTWAYDLSENRWENLTLGTHPSPREEFGMAGFFGSGEVMLFGGWSDKNDPGWRNITLGDTWLFDVSSNAWTNVSPAISPTGRFSGGLSAIPSDDKIVLFGGNPSATSWQEWDWWSTWTYDLGNASWTKVVVAEP